MLPTPLKAVAPAVRALLAIEQHKTDEAKAALQKGLAVADTPGIAAWLGSIALATGDEALARKGALTAVSFSAVYPPARMLAARVALLGARLDEALKASEELPPASPDVAIVTAAVAYEKLDGERMRERARGAARGGEEAPVPRPARARSGAHGRQRAGARRATRRSTWPTTTRRGPISSRWTPRSTRATSTSRTRSRPSGTASRRPLRAVRLAKLARWDGKNDEADRLSRAALEGGTVTVRALAERVLVLVAIGKAREAIALFKTYPNVGGPLAKWLRAYAIASHGKLEEARAIVAAEDPPPALAPLPARTIAALAYGAVKDTRHGNEYVKAIVHGGVREPRRRRGGREGRRRENRAEALAA